MGEHLVLYVDRLMRPAGNAPVVDDVAKSSVASSSGAVEKAEEKEEEEEEGGGSGGEDEPLIQVYECRICQEEDRVKDLEVPCACSGSLKYAHRKCVQRWCDEKGDITCEICHQPYQPGYTAPPPPPLPEDAAIDLGGGWTISGTPLDLHDPRLLAIAEAERQFLEAEYDDYSATNASGAAFCRSAALILMALLLLRHAWTVPDADGDDDMSAFFSEAAAMAATQVAFILQSGQRRGLQFTIAPRPPVTAPQDAV